MKQNQKTRVIVDTDVAKDDLAALLYLLNHPEIEVIALLATGSGEIYCKNGIKLLQDELAYFGKEDIPVFCGQDEPLDGQFEFPKELRNIINGQNHVELFKNNRQDINKDRRQIHAADFLKELLLKEKKPIPIIVLGPLTNLALFLRQDKQQLVNKIEKIIVMGGNVFKPGNIDAGYFKSYNNSVSEWNIFADPLSAKEVFESQINKIELISLDGTEYAPLTKSFLKKIENIDIILLSKFQEIYDLYIQKIKKGEISESQIFFWDIVAATVLQNNKICKYEEYPLKIKVEIETNKTKQIINKNFNQILPDGSPRNFFVEQTAGQMIVDKSGKNISVCVFVDQQEFENEFIKVLEIPNKNII